MDEGFDLLAGGSEREVWDAEMWAAQGQRAPFSVLVEYAAALLLEHLSGQRAVGAGEITLPTPMVCLTALACYDMAGRHGGHADQVVGLVRLADVLAILEDEAQARRVAVIEPGNPAVIDGRVRAEDRAALVDAVHAEPDVLWQQWRRTAADAVRDRLRVTPSQRLGESVDLVRRWRIRRGWYDDRSLPAMHSEDAPPDHRSAP